MDRITTGPRSRRTWVITRWGRCVSPKIVGISMILKGHLLGPLLSLKPVWEIGATAETPDALDDARAPAGVSLTLLTLHSLRQPGGESHHGLPMVSRTPTPYQLHRARLGGRVQSRFYASRSTPMTSIGPLMVSIRFIFSRFLITPVCVGMSTSHSPCCG